MKYLQLLSLQTNVFRILGNIKEYEYKCTYLSLSYYLYSRNTWSWAI